MTITTTTGPTTTTRSATTRTPRRHHRRAGLTLLVLGLTAAGTACVQPPAPPAGTKVVVFDIDGTLTTDELADSAQPNGNTAVNAYLAKGYNVVYVTARWNVLESSTRSWLEDNGFPDRPLYLAPSLLVSDSSKVDYKTDVLNDITSAGSTLVYAYGDSSSDFDAYANAGLPQSRVYALQRGGASSCQPGVFQACLTDGYTSHLSFISSVPAA